MDDTAVTAVQRAADATETTSSTVPFNVLNPPESKFKYSWILDLKVIVDSPI